MSEQRFWYVYVKNGDHTGYPVGPFTSKEDADPFVAKTRDHVSTVKGGDPMAIFYEWGVASLDISSHRMLNHAVGYTCTIPEYRPTQ